MAWNLGAIVVKFVADTLGWSKGHKIVQADVRALGREVTALGAALTGWNVAALREFGSFDKAMRESTAVSDITQQQFDQMSAMAERMSVELNIAASEAAAGFYYLGSAGLNAAEQMAAFIPVTEMARAMVISTAEAAEGLVDVMKGFNIAFSESEKVASQLVKTVITSNQVFADLDKAMSYVSSTATLANNKLSEMAALLGVMANAGIKGSYAGTGMRRSLTNLIAPTAAMKNLLRNLNVEVYDSEGKMKSYITIIGELSDALTGYSERYKGEAFKTLFGVRAIAGQIKVFEATTKKIREYAGEIENASTALDDVTRKQMMAFLNQLGRLWRMVQQVTRSIGESLVPNIRALIAELIPMLQIADDWISDNSKLVTSIAKITAGVGALALVVGPLLIMLPTLVRSFELLVLAITGVGIPIAVFVAGVYALRVTWSDAFESMRSTVDDFGDKFGAFSEDMQIAWSGSLQVMGETFTELFNRIMTGYAKIGVLAQFAWKTLKTNWRALTPEEAEWFKVMGEFLKDPTAMNFWEPFAAGIKKVSVGMKELVISDLGKLKTKLAETYPEVAALIDKMREALKGPGVVPGFPASPGTGGSIIDYDPEEEGARADSFADIWASASQAVINDFGTLNDKVTEGMNGIVDGWGTALSGFMQLTGTFGSKFKKLMDDIFDAVYQSFVNVIAKMAAERMFIQLLGANYTPYTRRQLLEREGLPAVEPAAIFGIPSMMGKAAPSRGNAYVNITNNGQPMAAKVTSMRYIDRDLILNVVTEGIESDANFRQNVRGG